MPAKPWLLAPLLGLAACYAEPYPYAQPGYPPPGYPPQAYAQPYPGYEWNNGYPTIIDAGVPVPLVFLDGTWGYYDHGHRWHRAPDAVYRHLEQQRSSGAFHPGAQPPPNRGNGPPPPQRQSEPQRAAAPANGQRPPPQREEHERRRQCPNNETRC